MREFFFSQHHVKDAIFSATHIDMWWSIIIASSRMSLIFVVGQSPRRGDPTDGRKS